MCKNRDKLNLSIIIDNECIYKFDEKINENSMIKSAKHIEQLLIDKNTPANKMQNVFELLIEVMQNILNYSSDSINLEDNKKEAHGTLTLSYNSQNDSYILQSCNLIFAAQEEIIKERVSSLIGLDAKALRKLSRVKMRTKEDTHDNGAGLGFIMMARKSIEPIDIKFMPYKDDIVQYRLKLVI